MNEENVVMVEIPIGYTLIKTEEYAAMIAHNITLDRDCSDSSMELQETIEKLNALKKKLHAAGEAIDRVSKKLDHYWSFFNAEPYAMTMLLEYEKNHPDPGADYAEAEEN